MTVLIIVVAVCFVITWIVVAVSSTPVYPWEFDRYGVVRMSPSSSLEYVAKIEENEKLKRENSLLNQKIDLLMRHPSCACTFYGHHCRHSMYYVSNISEVMKEKLKENDCDLGKRVFDLEGDMQKVKDWVDFWENVETPWNKKINNK